MKTWRRSETERIAVEVGAVSEVLKDEATRLMDESENLRRLVEDLRHVLEAEENNGANAE